jgi:probable phosphoglycerate mutase
LNEPLRLFLVRHGETAWSMTGQHTGQTDIALTAHGQEEARALGVRLRATAFTTVLTSPLRRARQTCELAGLGVAAQVEPDLAEWHYGDYEGERTALFTHGQFGAALAARWIELAVGAAQHLPLDPACLSLLAYEQGHATVPVIALWNAGNAGGLAWTSR